MRVFIHIAITLLMLLGSYVLAEHGPSIRHPDIIVDAGDIVYESQGFPTAYKGTYPVTFSLPFPSNFEKRGIIVENFKVNAVATVILSGISFLLLRQRRKRKMRQKPVAPKE